MDKEKPPLDSPVPLEARHDLAPFDCGVPVLNNYLKKFALHNQHGHSARTYVATRGETVVGYYTLAAASARREETPARVARGLAAHPVPVILLARLAVDEKEKGQGLGAGLLRDALLRVVQAADIVGCRAVMVHAKDDAAKAFYQRFGFEPSPGDPRAHHGPENREHCPGSESVTVVREPARFPTSTGVARGKLVGMIWQTCHRPTSSRRHRNTPVRSCVNRIPIEIFFCRWLPT